MIADGYCHLLVLYRKDFRDLLDKRPAIQTLTGSDETDDEADTDDQTGSLF